MTDEQSVLNREHYEVLKKAQRALHDALPIFDKAEECGVDCQLRRAAAAEVARELEAIERLFLTPPPRF